MKCLHALIVLSVLSITAVPNVSNAAPHCTVEDQKRADFLGNYYDPEDAYEFGRVIQQFVANRDLAGLFGLVKGELSDGPRKRFVQKRTFGEVFTESWRNAVLASAPPCQPVGWRGFMLANGEIWFTLSESDVNTPSTGYIFRIYGASKEDHAPAASDSAWRVEGRILLPQCFVRMRYVDISPNLHGIYENLVPFLETVGIKNLADFSKNPGRYFGREIEIDRLDPINRPDGDGEDSLVTFLSMCSVADSDKPNETTTPLTISEGGVLSKKCDKDAFCIDEGYQLLAPLLPATCQKLAPHLSGRCESAYLVRRGNSHGSNMRWEYRFNIYGLFALDDGRRVIVPLVNFYTENEARNFIDDIGAGR